MASNSKEIKTFLKEAREAIKNKDFQSCLTLCKTILKDDAENYMALVFLGLSLQEVGPKDQVPEAFKKAIDINCSNVLAWNGLANYYEKIGGAEIQNELIPIYIKILEIESNDKKVVEICEKVTAMDISQENTIEFSGQLAKIAVSTDLLKETSMTVWLTLASIVSKVPELPSVLTDIYRDALSFILADPKFITKRFYNDYVKLLYKEKNYIKVFEEAEKMFKVYDTDTIPLEWICKIYNELVIEEQASILTSKEIRQVCDTLLSLQIDSSMGLFTKAIFLFEEQKFFESAELLTEVTTLRSGLLHAWVLLATCLLKLHLYNDSLHAAYKADKLLLSMNNANTILRKKVDILLLESLSQHNDDDNLEKGVKLAKKLDLEDPMTAKCLIRCYINLDSFSEAEALLLKLEENFKGKSLLTSQLMHKQGKLKEALDLLLLEEPEESSAWWFEVALLYWDLQQCEQSLVPLLKAAKLDQNCYVYFLYLGHYYKKSNNPEKARRCYEKTFRLNPKCIEAAVELTKLFRANKNWDANASLLQSVTGDVLDIDNEWAWIQLGLNYLAQEEYPRAIDALRYVLRVNPNNSHCWESLGDAYMGRGAYTSALKSYQKASELSPSAIYPLLQKANIRRILGEYTEARANFEEILSTSKKYVPALKGLTETCVLQARQFKQNYLFGAARDCAQYALDLIVEAIVQRNDLSCLWKLAGDCCFLVAHLPERYCCMFVLASLAEGIAAEGRKILEVNELYTLAERFYYKAATLCKESASVWYDLAACFLSHAQILPHNEQSEQLYLKAANVVEHCIKLNATNWKYWNLKGLIAVTSDSKNYSLAQHSFIKAVAADDHSAIAWCNLGVLYVLLEEFKLANKAFAQAQRADPNYINCWIGQALIAESLDYVDAMDLFRHSTELGVHPESCIGYGNWVCMVLLNMQPEVDKYAIHNMHAIPVACDALTWYTDYNPDDACAWNMLGILRERMGLKDGAAQAFKSALYLCDKKFKDKARINYARSLFKQQKYKQAIEVYKDVQEATFNSGSGLALALFKDHRYEESYEVYEQALNWLTEEQASQSDLLVALATMAYMFQGPDAAKTLLSQSMELKSPSPYGFYATLAVALLHKDKVLQKQVLKELRNRIHDPQILQHYIVLFTYTCLLENNYNAAIIEISRLVHLTPNNGFLWLSLSCLFLRIYEKKSDLLTAGVKASQRATKLELNSSDATKAWCSASVSLLLMKNYKEAIRLTQHAVHSYPHLAEMWSVFIAVLLKYEANFRKIRIMQFVNHVKDHLNPYKSLSHWLQRISKE